MEQTRVYVMKRNGRRYFECQWADPITGKKQTKSTGTTVRREAERFAGALEIEINAGSISNKTNLTWDALADRYENEALVSRAKKTRYKFTAVRTWFKKLIDAKFARTIDASLLSKFQSELRSNNLTEATIKGHLSAFRACLNWAGKLGLIAKVPVITMPKRVNRMKGRPISLDEFKVFLEAVEPEVGEDFAYEFKRLLYGLWLSGLRLDEANRMTWEPTSDGISVDLTGDVPRLRIEANEDKSTKARLLPMTPDFAAFLLETPESERSGRVFKPRVDGMITDHIRTDTLSKVLSRVGKRSAIVVAEYRPLPGQTETRKKYVSAHDLRRTFGTRWAPHVTPQQLQQLMRQGDLKTAMTFYVVTDLKDVETATKDKKAAVANDSANILPFKKKAS